MIASFIEFDSSYLPSQLQAFFTIVGDLAKFFRIDVSVISSVGSLLERDWGKPSFRLNFLGSWMDLYEGG